MCRMGLSSLGVLLLVLALREAFSLRTQHNARPQNGRQNISDSGLDTGGRDGGPPLCWLSRD